MATNQIRIAIIGGGLAGASLANALSPVPHISVQLFEAAPTFSERGAAVGLSVNAQLALKETLEASERILKNAGSVPMTSTRVMIVSCTPSVHFTC
jgi:salicylate hydroxylase